VLSAAPRGQCARPRAVAVSVLYCVTRVLHLLADIQEMLDGSTLSDPDSDPLGSALILLSRKLSNINK
jgi:hypothetical protein